MSKKDKLIQKIFANAQISYEDAESILLSLGFAYTVTGSHHVFRKLGYFRNITLKKRSQLLTYQIKMLKEVLIYHGYLQN